MQVFGSPYFNILAVLRLRRVFSCYHVAQLETVMGNTHKIRMLQPITTMRTSQVQPEETVIGLGRG